LIEPDNGGSFGMQLKMVQMKMILMNPAGAVWYPGNLLTTSPMNLGQTIMLVIVMMVMLLAFQSTHPTRHQMAMNLITLWKQTM
jgi:hypothetical protein